MAASSRPASKKGVRHYTVKGYRVDAKDALSVNGGRIGHFSRGFFPHGVRRAEVEALVDYERATGEPSHGSPASGPLRDLVFGVVTEGEQRFVDAYQAIGYAVALAAKVEFMCAVIAIRVGVDRAWVHDKPTTDVIKKIHALAGDSDLASAASDALRTHGANQLLKHRHTFIHGRLWDARQSDGFTMSRVKRDGNSYAVAVPYLEFNKIIDRFTGLIGDLSPCMPDGVRALTSTD